MPGELAVMPPVRGFAQGSLTCEGQSRRVPGRRRPAVIVIHEVQGLHAGVVRFGQRLVEAGCTVYLASLFGRLGRQPSRPGSSFDPST